MEWRKRGQIFALVICGEQAPIAKQQLSGYYARGDDKILSTSLTYMVQSQATS